MLLGAVIAFLLWLALYIVVAIYTNRATNGLARIEPDLGGMVMWTGAGAAIGYLITLLF